MYGEYDPEVLEKVHEKEKELLKDFIYICDKYHIDYFVISGTAIGVLRHGGFIPWDDDIDVAMLRKDYQKFIKVAPKEFETTFKGKYEMMGPEFQKKFYNLQPAMNMIGTKFINETAWAGGYEPGFFLDIFIYENIPEDEEAAKKVVRTCRLCEILYIIRNVHFMKLIPTHPLLERPKLLIYGLIGGFLRLIPRSDAIIYHHYKKAVKPYYKKTKRYSAVMDPGALIMDVHEDEIYPLVDKKFEGLTIKMVHEYEEQLTRHMGDYMLMPPENKRTNHCPRVIEFGD